MSVCARCGALGETKQVTVLQSIGLLIAVRFKSVGGQWCRPCIDAELGPASLITATFGWLSVTGIFLTPFFLALNLATFLRTRGMQLPTSAPPLPSGTPLASPSNQPQYGPPPTFGAPSPSASRPIAATVAMTTPMASPSAYSAPSAGASPSPAPAGNGLAIGIGLVGAAAAGLGLLLMAFFGYLWAFGTNPGDQQFSPLCLGLSFIACVLPGLGGAGYALFRVMR